MQLFFFKYPYYRFQSSPLQLAVTMLGQAHCGGRCWDMPFVLALEIVHVVRHLVVPRNQVWPA
jgi:hypothetical protein